MAGRSGPNESEETMSNETKQQNVEQNRSDDLGSVKIQVKEVNLSAAQPSRAVRRTYPNR